MAKVKLFLAERGQKGRGGEREGVRVSNFPFPFTLYVSLPTSPFSLRPSHCGRLSPGVRPPVVCAWHPGSKTELAEQHNLICLYAWDNADSQGAFFSTQAKEVSVNIGIYDGVEFNPGPPEDEGISALAGGSIVLGAPFFKHYLGEEKGFGAEKQRTLEGLSVVELSPSGKQDRADCRPSGGFDLDLLKGCLCYTDRHTGEQTE